MEGFKTSVEFGSKQQGIHKGLKWILRDFVRDPQRIKILKKKNESLIWDNFSLFTIPENLFRTHNSSKNVIKQTNFSKVLQEYIFRLNFHQI